MILARMIENKPYCNDQFHWILYLHYLPPALLLICPLIAFEAVGLGFFKWVQVLMGW